MSKKIEFIIQISLAAVIILISLWFFYMYAGKFYRIHKLSSEGVNTMGEIKIRGVLYEGEVRLRENTTASDNHHFLVSYTNSTGNEFFCKLPVSKKRYESHDPGDVVSVAYLPADPGKCMLVSEIEFNYSLLSIIISLGLFFILLGLLFIVYIYSQYKKPDSAGSPFLTTSFENDRILCPECGTPMEEGYIPVTGGITWRERNESTGIPTIMSGLPGTVFWYKRPKLHAFRCRNCRNVIFKHG